MNKKKIKWYIYRNNECMEWRETKEDAERVIGEMKIARQDWAVTMPLDPAIFEEHPNIDLDTWEIKKVEE